MDRHRVTTTINCLILIACNLFAGNMASQDVEYQGWHLKDSSEGYRGISLGAAYKFLEKKTARTVVVAIMDSGFDTAHEDLRPVLWTNQREVPGNGVDDDGNGYVDDKYGWNFVKDGAPPKRAGSKSSLANNEQCDKILQDRLNVFKTREYVFGNDSVSHAHYHGTHTAGIIGAVRNNGKGIEGISDHIQIMTLNIFVKKKIYDSDLAVAIRYAVDNGAKIINLSLGQETTTNKECVDEAIRYAASKQVLIVRSAGNESENIDQVPVYPSPYYDDSTRAGNWIEVGASSPGMTGSPKASFSNFGSKRVDVLAPGVRIYSTFPGSKYEYEDGTSMAAPIVTGIAALLWAYYPHFSAEEIKQIIEESTVKVNGRFRLERFCRTGGIVNAYTAVLLAEKKSKAREKLP